MNIDYNKIIKMVVLLSLLCIAVGGLSKVLRQTSESLTDYAEANPDLAYLSSDEAGTSASAKESSQTAEDSIVNKEPDLRSNLAAALLNTSQSSENYTVYSEGFYYAPLSENLQKYILGKSYPDEGTPEENLTMANHLAKMEDLRYLHIWYFDFEGNPMEGELICSKAIAPDLAEIFCELYRNKYRLSSVKLTDDFNGSCSEAIEANNSFCFGFDSLHAAGLAVTINPVYNPSVSFDAQDRVIITPSDGEKYSERSKDFPYKIDSDDLCCRLFTAHGFLWGGNQNFSKNYGYFEKPAAPSD